MVAQLLMLLGQQSLFPQFMELLKFKVEAGPEMFLPRLA